MSDHLPKFVDFMTPAAKARFLDQLEAHKPEARATFLAMAQARFDAPPPRILGFSGDECNKEVPGARRWKVVLEGFSYYTCEHSDPHIDLVTG